MQNIEAELSYAYLHAVATRAGFICEVTGRHSDNAGIDAVLRVAEHALAEDSTLWDFTVEVQLKATSKCPSEKEGRYAYNDLPVKQYDKLRTTKTSTQRILVVLFLPEDAEQWLMHTKEHLMTRRCAYWVSLRGAPDSGNKRSRTVYLPKTNVLSMEGLDALMRRISREELIAYDEHDG
jgi:hypothetical protein